MKQEINIKITLQFIMMKFIVRAKDGYGQGIKDDVIGILEKNGAEYTEKIEPGCDFAVIVGGDGTLLRDHWRIDCPVLGINPGKSVGYYMTAGKNDYKKRVLALLKGKPGKDYRIHRLLRLRAAVNGKEMAPAALNDVLVSPVFVRRILQSRLVVDGKKSLERNSGIIVYTPTGSHAFAHSAGAKKLRYDSDMIGIAALAPYSGILKRQELLLKHGPVKIECLSDSGEVCIDGSELHIRPLKPGDVVTVKRSDKLLSLVGFKRHLA